ncbi:TIGR03668 family PPOX class F420-dependent oxidoreductase [Sphaerisporangium rubeum]|uniref:PPOX class probable F420-dependent enzyme n=1 Tax=Sphaerisporangium rubeum TaxID=321317 RepID=A0A7X0IKJ3_9ACTN|nr:TIGR03668 family PPOX class F420-dependent oxidoreductase [Sphaerisporangium rubeum]MBB6476895.1 PPOX class probable F420-dependent enzyme [Sphaerisporangium rubeum]
MDEHTRFSAAQVARLATVTPDGAPHLVPVTFAMQGDLVLTAVDHKPKTTTALRRLRNIEHDPRVSLLVDHFEDDWTHLWWIRADGHASILYGDDRPLAPLVAKYPQYAARPPEGPVIAVQVTRYVSWAYADHL